MLTKFSLQTFLLCTTYATPPCGMFSPQVEETKAKDRAETRRNERTETNDIYSWPTRAFKSEEEIKAVFPKHLCVAHIYYAYTFLGDKLEVPPSFLSLSLPPLIAFILFFSLFFSLQEQEKKKRATVAAKQATATHHKVAAKRKTKEFNSPL